MRLASLLTEHGPRVCALHDGQYVDLNASDVSVPTKMRSLLALSDWQARVERAITRSTSRHRREAKAFAPPVRAPQKIICLGLNYRDHAIESNMPIPEEPVLFSKFASALIGHCAPIELPPVSQQVDYEAELVVVIGKRGRDIPLPHAMSHVAGYCAGHDVSARDWQLNKPGKQWLAGKTFDTFAPVGPHFVSRDEVSDPHNLPISLRLNGDVMQNSTTAQLIFRIDETIAYISRVCTLEPGDLIFTGTPPGVGMARTPPVFLRPGDVAEVEIGGIDTLRNPVVQRPPAASEG